MNCVHQTIGCISQWNCTKEAASSISAVAKEAAQKAFTTALLVQQQENEQRGVGDAPYTSSSLPSRMVWGVLSSRLPYDIKNTKERGTTQVLLPQDFTPYTVIIGKARYAKENIGNRRLTVLASNHLNTYSGAMDKRTKSKVVRDLYDAIRNAGGTFVRECKESGGYVEVSESTAKDKIGYVLRYQSLTQKRSSSTGKKMTEAQIRRASQKLQCRMNQMGTYGSTIILPVALATPDTFGASAGGSSDSFPALVVDEETMSGASSTSFSSSSSVCSEEPSCCKEVLIHTQEALVDDWGQQEDVLSSEVWVRSSAWGHGELGADVISI